MINHILAIGTMLFIGFAAGRILARSETELQAEENINEARRIINRDKIDIS